MLKVKLQIECKSEASAVWMATKQGCKILERLASICDDNTKVSMKDYFGGKALKTRPTYNCAHLRSTKETLTIEYFRIILEKKFR